MLVKVTIKLNNVVSDEGECPIMEKICLCEKAIPCLSYKREWLYCGIRVLS